MARSVNVTQTNWRATGVNVQVPQYEMTETIEWTDDDGVEHTDTRTARFPNLLTQVPTAWVGRKLKVLVYEAHRRFLGIDTEDD